jgi:diacylglycerol kinase (ATP)
MRPVVLIFANPIAGRGRARVIGNQLAQTLGAAGVDARLILERPSAAPLNGLNPDTSTVISIGGDGSLREVVELLLAGGNPPPPILVVPMGTANLMGRHLGVRWAAANLPAAVLATVRRRKIVHLDAGRANGKLFLLMAGVGIDGQVVHLLDRMRTGPIDFTSYVLPTALSFAGYRFPAITVQIDGDTVASDLPAIAFVGNVREYGIGLPLLTRARPDDGLLDLCVMPCADLRDVAGLLLNIAAGEHPLREDVIYMRGKSIRIASAEPVPVQVDGDSAGYTPVEINVLPSAVPCLLPA